jgi:hypothetical protein
MGYVRNISFNKENGYEYDWPLVLFITSIFVSEASNELLFGRTSLQINQRMRLTS